MLVISRYRVDRDGVEEFLDLARTAMTVLSSRPGCLDVRLGRAVDDGELWAMTSRWESVGAYRRALSSAEVKLHAVPLMYRCVDEPSAFEVRLEAAGGEVVAHPGALADEGR